MSQVMSALVEAQRLAAQPSGRTIHPSVESLCATSEFLLLRNSDGSEARYKVSQRLTIMHRNGRHELTKNQGHLLALFLRPSADSHFSVHVEEQDDQIVAAVNEQVF